MFVSNNKHLKTIVPKVQTLFAKENESTSHEKERNDPMVKLDFYWTGKYSVRLWLNIFSRIN